MLKRVAALLFLATTALSQPNDPKALMHLGHEALLHGDADKAVELLEKAAALQPKSAEVHYQLGGAYGQAAGAAGMFGAMSLGKKAEEEWQRAVQLDPNYLPARFALIEFNVLAPAMFGGSESAAMEQAVEIRKRDAMEGHRAFARIYIAAKKLDLARKEYVDMLREHPQSARAHYFYGVYLMVTEKNYAAANGEFESVLKLDSAYMPAYFQIGHVAAVAANNFARGEEALKKYLAYKPKDDEPVIARAWYWLGTVYEKQGKKAEAKASYAASTKINPKQKDADAALKRVS